MCGSDKPTTTTWSVASLLLTTEVMIAEAPKDVAHAHGGAPGGMDM